MPQADGRLATVIDPGLEWSTLLGDVYEDWGKTVTVDDSGDVFLAGETRSPDFPSTPGAYNEDYNGGFSGNYTGDAFVCRLDPAQTGDDQLVFCTFLGGTRRDRAWDLVLQPSGAVVVVGYTCSSDFPTTDNAFNENNKYREDVFISRFNSTGSVLEYSTYFGSTGAETHAYVAGDANGDIYVCGRCMSFNDPHDLPTKAENGGTPFQPDWPGDLERTAHGFLARFRLESNGEDDLIYSTYIGGSNADSAYGLVVHTPGVVTVIGLTDSTDFPTSEGAYDRDYNGGYCDSFVMRLSLEGNGAGDLVYSTFLGGSEADYASAVAVNGSGEAIAAGSALSDGFPTTSGAYDRTYNGGSTSGDVFVCKFNHDGSALLYSTFLGGSGDDGITYNGLSLDWSGAAVLAGYTASDPFPTTDGAYDTTYNGGEWDAFVTRIILQNGITELDYSTYIGHDQADIAAAVDMDPWGKAVVVGYTASADFPTSEGAYDRVHAGDSRDTFVLRLGIDMDTDGDGVLDPVDKHPETYNDHEEFSDVGLGGETTGTITDRGGQILTITEEPNPAGVETSADSSGGGADAVISACGGTSEYYLSAGDKVIVTCGSVTIEVVSGTVEITFFAVGGGTATVSLDEGNSLTFDPDTYTVTAPPDNPDTVVVVIDGER